MRKTSVTAETDGECLPIDYEQRCSAQLNMHDIRSDDCLQQSAQP
jgi:hypothetical protein